MSKNLVETNKKKRFDLDTYVFIDASNIREACRKSCGFCIDFLKFHTYLTRKYPKLRAIRYYEGVALDDKKKREYFEMLRKCGYIICSLERKSYTSPAKYKTVSCPKCSYNFKIGVAKKITKMKSNVDVYLASEFLQIAAENKKPKRLILVSCDGDYAEMIKIATEINSNLRLTVLATPFTSRNNFLSSRLRILSRELDKYIFKLDDISKIAEKISR
ncbi:MAG: NYN domain-containing protein [Candidatus Saccharibacteria bacterium]|nr:NYN domain-containing protein [Candidatus Saccharibacteria bacterium]